MKNRVGYWRNSCISSVIRCYIEKFCISLLPRRVLRIGMWASKLWLSCWFRAILTLPMHWVDSLEGKEIGSKSPCLNITFQGVSRSKHWEIFSPSKSPSCYAWFNILFAQWRCVPLPLTQGRDRNHHQSVGLWPLDPLSG